MKEIRLHGRGGQGVVKASQMVVAAAVKGGLHGQFIPFFGVERKGSPVFGYLRLSGEEIRRKTQIYEPDVIVVMDDTLTAIARAAAGDHARQPPRMRRPRLRLSYDGASERIQR